MKNLTTHLLPAWRKTLSAHGLSSRMMPRDVSTCWNSTFDMLEFAIQYRVAIDAMTAVHKSDLRKYELVSAEWMIAAELRDILKVSNPFSPLFLPTYIVLSRFSKMQHSSFLVASPTWPLSSLQWTSSTRPLPHCLTHHISTPPQSVLHSPSGNGLYPSTTTKLRSQKSIISR